MRAFKIPVNLTLCHHVIYQMPAVFYRFIGQMPAMQGRAHFGGCQDEFSSQNQHTIPVVRLGTLIQSKVTDRVVRLMQHRDPSPRWHPPSGPAPGEAFARGADD